MLSECLGRAKILGNPLEGSMNAQRVGKRRARAKSQESEPRARAESQKLRARAKSQEPRAKSRRAKKAGIKMAF